MTAYRWAWVRLVLGLLGLALLFAIGPGCVVRPDPIVVPPQPPPDRYVRVTVRGADGLIVGAGGAVVRDDEGRMVVCDWLPQLACRLDPGMVSGHGATLELHVDGYEAVAQRFVIAATGQNLDDIQLRRAGFDPSGVPLEQLARIRGAMWTETYPCSLGPRPWQPNNICATDFLWNYTEAQRLAIVENLVSLGYTHAVVGPLVDSDGYHGVWTPNDWRGARFAEFLDMCQFLWDHGLAPVVFITPDNWSLERAQAELSPLLQQERAQRLIRIAVRAWEPCKYECSSFTWAAYGQWLRSTLPHALVLLHTVCDVDAPVGTDALGDDNGKDNALGWHRVAPFYHGWLTQSCTFERADGVDDENGLSNFVNWTRLFDPTVRGSYPDRFRHGYAGWPMFSAWGPTTPLRVYAAEYFAFPVMWQKYTTRPMTKEEARRWGDAAMRAGADGYLDGGSLPVGEGDVPWQR